MTNVMPLHEIFRLLANFICNKILSNENDPPLLSFMTFYHATLLVPFLVADKVNNYNILRTDIHNLFKIPFALQCNLGVIKFLPAKIASHSSRRATPLLELG